MRTHHPETVTVLRVSKDEFGDQSIESTTAVAGCTVLPQLSGSETEAFDQDTTTVNLMIVVPSGTDIRVTDAVIVRGERYRVANTPVSLVSPFSGRDSGVGVSLQRSTG